MQEHNVQETQERQEPEEVQVPVPKVGFVSLGCAKNQVNCEQMIWKTYEAGYEVALGAEGCDVAVVNTCGFLKEARDEAMGEIDKLVRQKQAGNLKKIIWRRSSPRRKRWSRVRVVRISRTARITMARMK